MSIDYGLAHLKATSGETDLQLLEIVLDTSSAPVRQKGLSNK